MLSRCCGTFSALLLFKWAAYITGIHAAPAGWSGAAEAFVLLLFGSEILRSPGVSWIAPPKLPPSLGTATAPKPCQVAGDGGPGRSAAESSWTVMGKVPPSKGGMESHPNISCNRTASTLLRSRRSAGPACLMGHIEAGGQQGFQALRCCQSSPPQRAASRSSSCSSLEGCAFHPLWDQANHAGFPGAPRLSNQARVFPDACGPESIAVAVGGCEGSTADRPEPNCTPPPARCSKWRRDRPASGWGVTSSSRESIWRTGSHRTRAQFPSQRVLRPSPADSPARLSIWAAGIATVKSTCASCWWPSTLATGS